MAEEDAEEQEEQAPVAQAPPPSLLRYLPVVLVILLLQAGGAYFLVDLYWLKEEVSAVQDEEGRDRIRVPEGTEPEAAVDLGKFVANARGTRARLLVHATVTLGVAPSGVRSEIQDETNEDRVKDAILAELGNATYEELHSPEGREGVKQKIKNRINAFLYQGEILEVYFGEFYLQAMSGYGKN